MTEEKKKTLFKELDEKKKELNSLGRTLSDLKRDKEEWFQKKKEYSEQIRAHIASLKESKEKRDILTKQVKQSKETRNVLTRSIKKGVEEAKSIRIEPKKMGKVSEVISQNTIDKIEEKLEIEVMSPEKEKELNKKLRDIKKKFLQLQEIQKSRKAVSSLNEDLKEKRYSREKSHREVQDFAMEAQIHHEVLLSKSRQIDDLKKKEKEAYSKSKALKEQFSVQNIKVKEILEELNKIRSQLNEFKLAEEEQQKISQDKMLKQKEEEMEKKIKEGKKITTEDFLLLQNIDKFQKRKD